MTTNAGSRRRMCGRNFHVPLFLEIMIFKDVRLPPNFLNVPCFPISNAFQILLELLGALEIFIRPSFLGFHDFMGCPASPDFSNVPPDYHIFRILPELFDTPDFFMSCFLHTSLFSGMSGYLRFLKCPVFPDFDVFRTLPFFPVLRILSRLCFSQCADFPDPDPHLLQDLLVPCFNFQ